MSRMLLRRLRTMARSRFDDQAIVKREETGSLLRPVKWMVVLPVAADTVQSKRQEAASLIGAMRTTSTFDTSRSSRPTTKCYSTLHRPSHPHIRSRSGSSKTMANKSALSLRSDTELMDLPKIVSDLSRSDAVTSHQSPKVSADYGRIHSGVRINHLSIDLVVWITADLEVHQSTISVILDLNTYLRIRRTA